MTFKVGDRVKVNADGVEHWGEGVRDKIGTIKVIDNRGNIGVEFDEEMGGHVLIDRDEEHAKEGHGWWLYEHEINLLSSEPTEPTKPTKPTPDTNLNLDFSKLFMAITLGTAIPTPSKPPKLSPTERFKCRICGATYPYASKDSDGVLWFYRDLPNNIRFFKTADVKI